MNDRTRSNIAGAERHERRGYIVGLWVQWEGECRLKRIAVKNDILRREIVKRRSRLEPCSDEPVVGADDARVGGRSLRKICAARTVEYDLFGVMVARRRQVSDHGRKCCDRIGGVEFRDRSYKPSIGSD